MPVQECNNNFSFELERFFSDPEGRFIICDIKVDRKVITLANLYAPNQDNPQFFEGIFNHLDVFKCEEIIVGGDFNLVLDLAGDKKGGLAKTHTKALKVIEQYAAKLDLIDAWRVLNQDARRYTWRRRNPEIHCRLDFFLLSQSVMSNVKDTDISAGYKTDHSLITIKIAQHSNTRSPGFWKLNKSFLKETEYINQIRETIEQVKLEYREDKYVNPALIWEMIN